MLQLGGAYLLRQGRERQRACSQENESRSERLFGTWFGPFLIWKPDFTLCERKALSNQAFETRFETPKKGVLDRDPLRKPDSIGHVNAKLFRNVIRACAFWKCALKPCMTRVNQRGLRSGNKILPRSAQILIVIGKAFAMHVNAHSSNHDPNHEADRDPKRLSERDSFLCEHSHRARWLAMLVMIDMTECAGQQIVHVYINLMVNVITWRCNVNGLTKCCVYVSYSITLPLYHIGILLLCAWIHPLTPQCHPFQPTQWRIQGGGGLHLGGRIGRKNICPRPPPPTPAREIFSQTGLSFFSVNTPFTQRLVCGVIGNPGGRSCKWRPKSFALFSLNLHQTKHAPNKKCLGVPPPPPPPAERLSSGLAQHRGIWIPGPPFSQILDPLLLHVRKIALLIIATVTSTINPELSLQLKVILHIFHRIDNCKPFCDRRTYISPGQAISV